jgi:hypothetical protein
MSSDPFSSSPRKEPLRYFLTQIGLLPLTADWEPSMTDGISRLTIRMALVVGLLLVFLTGCSSLKFNDYEIDSSLSCNCRVDPVLGGVTADVIVQDLSGCADRHPVSGPSRDGCMLIDVYHDGQPVRRTVYGASQREETLEYFGLDGHASFIDSHYVCPSVGPYGSCTISVYLDALFDLKPYTKYEVVVRHPLEGTRQFDILYGACASFSTLGKPVAMRENGKFNRGNETGTHLNGINLSQLVTTPAFADIYHIRARRDLLSE